MKKIIIVLGLVFCGLGSLWAQYEQHQVVVRNIAVPLRVYLNGSFVEDITRDDIELYDNDQLQKVEALYLISKNEVARMDAERDYMPYTSRHFYFLFQILEYNPKITDALDFFFSNIFQPGDTLQVMTPMKNYTLSQAALKSKTKEQLVKDMVAVIRKDTQIGASEYNNLIKDLKRMVRAISVSGGQTSAMRDLESSDSGGLSGLQFLLPQYKNALIKLENLRFVEESRFLQFASQLKRLDGQKIVFFFYQREFRPEIHPRILNNLVSIYQDDPNLIGQIQDLFQFYQRETRLNIIKLQRAFADSSIVLNFLFMHKNPENISGVYMREQSEDVFKIFTDIAKATGGVVDTSQNPDAAFQTVAKTVERYYLLYYSPSNYVADSSFHQIKIRIKGRDYRLYYRRGYFAD